MLADYRSHQAGKLPADETPAVAGEASFPQIRLNRAAEIRSELGWQHPDQTAEEAIQHGQALRKARVPRAVTTILSSRAISAATTFSPKGVSR
jgi:hypothetical protein